MRATVDLASVDLAIGHRGPDCQAMSGPLYRQLSEGGYGRGASTMRLGDHHAYLADHRQTRKRAARARRLGYVFLEIQRELYADDVYEINTSLASRQGRPMSAGYQERPIFTPNPLRCPWHHVHTYGVLDRDRKLRAYLWLYRSGELAMVSSILGHGDHLDAGIMFLLVEGAIGAQSQLGGTLFYNRHDSGTEGLREFKERIGLQPVDVAWIA